MSVSVHMEALVREAILCVHVCVCVPLQGRKARLMFTLEDCMTSLSLSGLLE